MYVGLRGKKIITIKVSLSKPIIDSISSKDMDRLDSKDTREIWMRHYPSVYIDISLYPMKRTKVRF